MNSSVVPGLISSIIGIVCVVIGLVNYEGLTVSLSCFIILFSIISIFNPDVRVGRLILVGSIVFLVCTALLFSILTYDVLVECHGIGIALWSIIVASVRAISMPAVTLSALFSVAQVYHSSFNWVLAASLFPFVGVGMMIPGYAITFVIQGFDSIHGWVTNAYVMYGVFIPLILLALCALMIKKRMRDGRLLITDKGLVVRS